MEAMMEQFKDVQIIPFEEITKATNNFHKDNYLGGGGFGNVYKGELSQFKERGMVAFKRLDPRFGQGKTEFLKEISMLSQYKHENLISLLGVCIKEKEMILVYEYAAHRSLDFHLRSRDLTWTQRLKICFQAAEGLRYLHDPDELHLRVIHRDIKSANILLDDKWNAKIADVGLSKISPENANLVTVVTGTPGYTDPEYQETYTLTEHSDVYSFGVTLFEVLCGCLCYEITGENKVRVFVPKWKESYQENKLEEIIFKELDLKLMHPISIKLFSDIAYQCLNKSGKERPMMVEVVSKLKAALQAQERYDVILNIPLLNEHAETIQAAVPPMSYSSIEELSQEVILNGGKTWLSINEKGESIERINIEACLNPTEKLRRPSDFHIVNSRFPGGRCYHYINEFKARVRGQYLTPKISYTINLVFRYTEQSDVNLYNPLRYKIDGEEQTKVFIIYPSYMREDGWFIVPLYHLTTQHTTTDLHFDFSQRSGFISLVVAGIEFQPSEEKVELQHIVEAASQSLIYRSLQELKQILLKGIHLKDYKMWFALNEKGQHCHMISIEDCLIPNEDSTPRYESHYMSRFPTGLYQTNNKGFKTHVKTQFLSPSVTYTVNLVCHSYLHVKQVYVDLKYRLRGEARTSVVYLANRKQDNELHVAELFHFTNDGSIIDLEIIFDNPGSIQLVEGILFQPLEIVEDQVSKKDNVEDIQTVSDSESDTYWEQKLPIDYEGILDLSKDILQWTTKKELYSIIRSGFLIDNGRQWFAIDKHGKKCLMLSARETWVTPNRNSTFKSSQESRFREVLVTAADYKFEIKTEVKSKVVSPKTTYAAYLVFKLPQDQSNFETPVEVYDGNHGQSFIYLLSPPHTPVIGPKFDKKTYNLLNKHRGTAIPQQRSDGWKEVKVWEFQTTTNTVPMHLMFQHPCYKDLEGLMVQGIEIRPI